VFGMGPALRKPVKVMRDGRHYIDLAGHGPMGTLLGITAVISKLFPKTIRPIETDDLGNVKQLLRHLSDLRIERTRL
jgi:hypothetical protein